MSIIESNPIRLPVESLTPSIETDVFAASPEATFWIGVTAANGEVMMPTEYAGAGVLRANVYIDEKGFLADDERRPDGTEVDKDDERSTHFTVVENRLATDGIARVVGSGRLIHKRNKKDLLPVEQLFPEAFTTPAPVGSVEVSRFIARHPDKFTQSLISLSVIRAMALHCRNNGTEPAHAVIETGLARRFDMIGMDYEKLTELKMIDEYNTKNMAVRLDPSGIVEATKQDVKGEKLITSLFAPAVVEMDGIGYFDQTLIAPAPTSTPKVA